MNAKQLNELAKLLDSGKIRANVAKTTLEKMLETGKDVSAYISEQDLAGIDDETMRAICQKAVDLNPQAVTDYLGGKDKAFQVFIGVVMKETRGRADVNKAREMILSIIQK